MFYFHYLITFTFLLHVSKLAQNVDFCVSEQGKKCLFYWILNSVSWNDCKKDATEIAAVLKRNVFMGVQGCWSSFRSQKIDAQNWRVNQSFHAM